MAESPFSWRSAERMYRPYWGRHGDHGVAWAGTVPQGQHGSLGTHPHLGNQGPWLHPWQDRLCQRPSAGQASKTSQVLGENAGQGAAGQCQTFIPAPAHRGKERQEHRALQSPRLSCAVTASPWAATAHQVNSPTRQRPTGDAPAPLGPARTLTVQLPAHRFWMAPAEASRMAGVLLSFRREMYIRTTSGWNRSS